LLDAARPDIYRGPRLAMLTPAEQNLMLASANFRYPPLRSSEIGSASAKAPCNVNVVLGRLVDAGVL
jgi:hypothetical protein